MAVSFVSANAAYQAASGIANAGGAAQGAAGAAPSPNFGNILADTVKDAMSSMRAGEVAAAQGAAGHGDVVQVVNAVTAAELTLETVVAIRDKVISAYQDIIRMPI
jgi:flagellar hook-basal body complex protein FliE